MDNSNIEFYILVLITKSETFLLKLGEYLYTDDMKVFFDNYRDYFYIPDEDTAILKSLGALLPKGSYVKATKENCYQKVSGKFIKQ